MINNNIAKIDPASVFVSFKSNMIKKIRFQYAAELMKNDSIIIKLILLCRRSRRRRKLSFI